MPETLHRGTVSVVIPTHNRRHLLPRALASCAIQTHPLEEIIVVDDGSTDGTAEFVRGWAGREPRVRLVRLEENGGAQAARAAGIRECRSEWVAFLDSDDELLPGSVAVRVAAAETCGFRPGIVYGDTYREEPKGRELHAFRRFRGDAYAAICRDLMLANFIALMVRRECFEACGYPSGTLASFQDQDTALTIAKRFPVLHCGEAVAVAHRTPGQITSDGWKLAEGYRGLLEKYGDDVRRHHGPWRLFLCRVDLFRLRVRGLHRETSRRHRDMAARLARYRPERVAHAAYRRALGAFLEGLNRALRPNFFHAFRFRG
jgi:glycosyltransferase involved in cell wall biosynthesis